MDLQFFAPQSTGEWLAALAAAATFLVGLALMIAPRRMMGLVGLSAGSPAGISEIRGAFGGSWAGLGLAALLLAQPLVYLALGMAYAVAVSGRLLSFAADRALSARVVILTAVEALMAFALIAYPLRWIA